MITQILVRTTVAGALGLAAYFQVLAPASGIQLNSQLSQAADSLGIIRKSAKRETQPPRGAASGKPQYQNTAPITRKNVVQSGGRAIKQTTPITRKNVVQSGGTSASSIKATHTTSKFVPPSTTSSGSVTTLKNVGPGATATGHSEPLIGPGRPTPVPSPSTAGGTLTAHGSGAANAIRDTGATATGPSLAQSLAHRCRECVSGTVTRRNSDGSATITTPSGSVTTLKNVGPGAVQVVGPGATDSARKMANPGDVIITNSDGSATLTRGSGSVSSGSVTTLQTGQAPQVVGPGATATATGQFPPGGGTTSSGGTRDPLGLTTHKDVSAPGGSLTDNKPGGFLIIPPGGGVSSGGTTSSGIPTQNAISPPRGSVSSGGTTSSGITTDKIAINQLVIPPGRGGMWPPGKWWGGDGTVFIIGAPIVGFYVREAYYQRSFAVGDDCLDYQLVSVSPDRKDWRWVWVCDTQPPPQ